MPRATVRDVPDTAFMVTRYRAIESARPDALFHDPLAARLAGERGREIVDGLPQRAFIGGWSVVVRTVIIDELIAAAVERGVDTVLDLLCTRARENGSREPRGALFADIDASARGVLVVTEGLVPYLELAAVASLAGDLA